MKKFATLMLVALVAVSALFALVACSNEPLADPDRHYVITGQWNGWKVNTDAEDETKLDSTYEMTAIALNDSRVSSIKNSLKDAKYLYIAEYTFVNEGAGWEISYALTEGAEKTTVDGNMCVKVIRTKYETAGDTGAWLQEWIPSPEQHNIKTLTPETFYLPNMKSAEEAWEGSGAWNDNPMILKAGTYYIVYAEFNDGSMGLGLIAK